MGNGPDVWRESTLVKDREAGHRQYGAVGIGEHGAVLGGQHRAERGYQAWCICENEWSEREPGK